MKIGIICAMDEETAYFLSKLESYETKNVGQIIFYEGKTAEGKEVVISRSGIGKAKAATVTGLLIALYNVSYIINNMYCIMLTVLFAKMTSDTSNRTCLHNIFTFIFWTTLY